MRPRVVVTGSGAVTCLGADAAATWAALVAGRSGIAQVPRLASAGTAAVMGGAVPGSADDPAEAERELARRALAEACGSAEIGPGAASLAWASGLDAVTLAPAYRRTPSAEIFAALSAAFGGTRRRVATACSAGAQSIIEAVRALRAGRTGPWLAGGSSAMLTPFYVHGLARLAVLGDDREDGAVCRPFDRHRTGTVVSDGAVALVLETREAARQRGARAVAELAGIGTSQDAHDLFKPPPDGRGAELALRRAMDDAGLTTSRIAAVVAHATGTPGGDRAEVAALRRVLGARASSVPVTAPKGALGHMMMAAGAANALVAVRAVATGRLPPTAHLEQPDPACALDHVRHEARELEDGAVVTNAFGMGGHNVVLIFVRVEEP